MMKSILFASSIIFAASAYAGPNQIEIIGLVPGVSTQTQVENAKSEYGYVIGGYELLCLPEYIDGLLSQLLCVTGDSRDITANSYRSASNTEVHVALLKGFTKKFGTPSTIDNSTVSNRFGTEFNSNKAVWIDQKGNKLTLLSMVSKIDQGGVLLESAQQLRKDEAESRKADQQRNF
jgi:hypothetical protein